jgi:hypothetical protein
MQDARRIEPKLPQTAPLLDAKYFSAKKDNSARIDKESFPVVPALFFLG